ncbi:MAG: hypothetical protein MHM6MM_008486, partial [Cercozoa sp. M6MM]
MFLEAMCLPKVGQLYAQRLKWFELALDELWDKNTKLSVNSASIAGSQLKCVGLAGKLKNNYLNRLVSGSKLARKRAVLNMVPRGRGRKRRAPSIVSAEELARHEEQRRKKAIQARESREKKKRYVTDLEDSVASLQRQIEELRARKREKQEEEERQETSRSSPLKISPISLTNFTPEEV